MTKIRNKSVEFLSGNIKQDVFSVAVVMTINKLPSCHAGLIGRFLLSLTSNFWMKDKPSSFLGTRNTDPFTKKQCYISLILRLK